MIGHFSSNVSGKAGEIYRVAGIPAITASATSDDVTLENDWYFRVVFNNRSQGIFLADYVKKIMNQNQAIIIYDRDIYGLSLSRAFKSKFESLGGTIGHIGRFDSNNENLDKLLSEIAENIVRKSKENSGVIFLATHLPEAEKLIVLLKRKGVKCPIIGGDAIGISSFAKNFHKYPEEQIYPGYFSDGIYATSPILFDVAGKKAQDFKLAMINKYGHEPSSWSAAYYEAALVAIHAIKTAKIKGDKKNFIQDRQKIRDVLSSLNSPDTSIEGITGNIYFDKDGNIVKPLAIGLFQNQYFISALTQLQQVKDFNSIPSLEEELQAGRIIFVNDNYMHKTNVVYTGIEINEIRDLDIRTASYVLDFYLWFRYRGDFEPDKITFLNAAEPIFFKNSEEDEKLKTKSTASFIKAEQGERGLKYLLYHVKARFKGFIEGRHGIGEYNTLLCKFRHQDLGLNNLIYVTDIIGTEISDNRFFIEKRMQKSALLSSEYGWNIDNISFFQDTMTKSTMGNLKYINLQNKFVECSQFNLNIRIGRDTFRSSLRERISDKFIFHINIFNLIIFALILLLFFNKLSSRFPKFTWFFQTLFSLLFLLSSELALIKILSGNIDTRYLKLIIFTFDILWWIVPAFCCHLAFKPFIWLAMEKRTQRPVPNVVRRVPAYIISSIALYGIVVYVFDQNINKLMATSGMVAMIIGLIIKSNISDFFSGIVLNQGDAIRIGDWVRIGSFEEGKIVDVTWRATSLETRDGSFLTIPNSDVLGSSINNYSYPNNYYCIEVDCEIEQRQKHDRVEKILLDAALGSIDILKSPEPSVNIKGQGDGTTIFSVKFSVRNYAKKNYYLTEIRKRIQTHLEYAGIGAKGIKKDQSGAVAVLRETDIFQLFSEKERKWLSTKMKNHNIPPGVTCIRAGDNDNSLFIISEGVVGVWIQMQGGELNEIARLGPGDIIGEMALLTGKPRTATIISITDTYIFQILKKDIEMIMKEYPQIREHLDNILNKRKKMLEAEKNENTVQQAEKEVVYSLFLNKILNFFSLKSKFESI